MGDTIAAIGTALGEGGIGIIRISGKASEKIIDELFVPHNQGNWKNRQSHKLYLGHFRGGIGQDKYLDQVLVVVMKGPNSYTGEDGAEIHSHGGILVVSSILEEVLKAGARLAEPGEFTRRAFFHGKLDLSQAEATIDLIRAKSDAGLNLAVAQLEGQLSQEIDDCQGEIIKIIAYCEAIIDFPDDEIEVMLPNEMTDIIKSIQLRLEKLLLGFSKGRVLKEGLKTVILGKPNVGKSTLLNALLGKDKAIVTDIPGTTRDLIEELVNFGGIPLKLIDTAGIHQTEDKVEQIGIKKTKEALKEADLALLILDAGTAITNNDQLVWQLTQEAKIPLLILLNKIDLKEQALDVENVEILFPEAEILTISALTRQGLLELEEKIKEMISFEEINRSQEPLLTRIRHVQALRGATDHLGEALKTLKTGLSEDFLTIDLKAAWDYLGEINGKTVGEDVLDQIFADFCIGK